MENSKIYAAISAVMSEVGVVGKDKKNQQQGFKYRGIDDVMNALSPALAKNHIFVVPEVLEQTREDRQTKNGGSLTYSILKIKYTFYAEDGSSVSAIVIGEGMDSGDKASNKSMSIAFKYACFQVFCIPTEEMKDPDAETPPETVPKQGNPTESKPEYIDAIKQSVFMTALHRTGYSVIAGLKSIAKEFPSNPPKSIGEITEQQFAKVILQLDKLPDKPQTKKDPLAS